MDILLSTLLEIGMFFILLVVNLQLFNSLDYERFFKKGHVKQIQMTYFFTVIIFTYLLTKALMNLIMLFSNLAI